MPVRRVPGAAFARVPSAGPTPPGADCGLDTGLPPPPTSKCGSSSWEEFAVWGFGCMRAGDQRVPSFLLAQLSLPVGPQHHSRPSKGPRMSTGPLGCSYV